MTQADVESLATKNFIQEISSGTLSPEASIVTQTNKQESRWLHVWASRHAKHIDLMHLWTQEKAKEGKLEFER